MAALAIASGPAPTVVLSVGAPSSTATADAADPALSREDNFLTLQAAVATALASASVPRIWQASYNGGVGVDYDSDDNWTYDEDPDFAFAGAGPWTYDNEDTFT